LLLLINSCFNPAGLFCTSSPFRQHLKRYLTYFCKTIPLLLISNLQEEIEFLTLVYIFFGYIYIVHTNFHLLIYSNDNEI